MNSTNANDNSSALRTLLDRAEITQVVQDWGLARDTCRWEKLRSFHTADGKVQTTWFAGSATEFVERSRQAAAAGAKVQHFIGAATIELNGERAVAETRMVLQVRAAVQGVPVDVTCYGLFHDLFVRNADGWRIQQCVPVYEKDRIDTLVPNQALQLDAERLAALPDGCRHLTYVQSQGGAQITPDLTCPYLALRHLTGCTRKAGHGCLAQRLVRLLRPLCRSRVRPVKATLHKPSLLPDALGHKCAWKQNQRPAKARNNSHGL